MWCFQHKVNMENASESQFLQAKIYSLCMVETFGFSCCCQKINIIYIYLILIAIYPIAALTTGSVT